MKMLTDAEIEELRALLEKATPGPWTEAYGHLGDTRGRSLADEMGWFPHEGDAALIAAARNALPALLDEVRRSRALLRRIEWGAKAHEVCPACDGFNPALGNALQYVAPKCVGHTPDCEVGALLARDT